MMTEPEDPKGPEANANWTVKQWCDAAHKVAREKGWWDGVGRPVTDLLMLIADEVFEAFREYRNHRPENIGPELADVVIRVFDACEGLGIDLQTEIANKHEINRRRPHRHGGKLL